MFKTLGSMAYVFCFTNMWKAIKRFFTTGDIDGTSPLMAIVLPLIFLGLRDLFFNFVPAMAVAVPVFLIAVVYMAIVDPYDLFWVKEKEEAPEAN